MLSGQRSISKAYRGLLEELIGIADQYYRDAFEWIPALPVALQRSMAVAARVYGGIHDAVRANGYDNLRQRAHTSLPVKVRLAIGALVSLRTAVKFGPPCGSAFVPDTVLEWSNGHG